MDKSPIRPAPVCALIAITVFLTVSAILQSRHTGATRMEMCANNLRQIGLEMETYLQNGGGVYPDSFAPLLADGLLPPEALVCPDTADTPARGPTTRAIQADLNSGGHLSYVYVGRGLTKALVTSRTVLAYEPLSNHESGLHVLFGDHHVEYLTEPAADQFLAKVAAGEFPVSWP
jgi:hypothetical protein